MKRSAKSPPPKPTRPERPAFRALFGSRAQAFLRRVESARQTLSSSGGDTTAVVEGSASERGSYLASVRLTVDGVKFGRFIACRQVEDGMEFEGNEAVRTVVGGWSVQFSFGEPRVMQIRKI